MAEHWWRAYDGSIDHPKLLRLSDAMHRAWFTLQCIASANGGILPPAADVALRLRMKPAKVGEWITHLVGAGLIDRDGDVFRPHNWDERQYKTDTKDPTAASRAKNYRDRKRDANRDDRDATVTRERPEAETEQITEQIAVADSARAPLVSGPAFALAERLLVIAGHDPKFWPPGWCGAPMRVQTWLSEGWGAEIIEAAVTSSARKRRGAPAASVQFFENAIAEEVARQAAPLPKVEIREAEKVVSYAKPKNAVIQAADDLCRTIAGFDGPSRSPDELRRATGETPPRLLSNR